MTKIHQLDKQTANSIAAGEVVERPASIVKELVENALDAGATVIHTAISQGGIRLVKVSDNGCGMDAQDAKLAFDRHATSKLQLIEDLDALATMGFRGEALASVAAVSKVKLETREPGSEQGYRICIEGGELKEEGPVGCAEGTTLQVEHLFYNMPARFKFLRKDTTEANVITDMMMRLALARPDVSFRLTNNQQEVLHTPGNNDLKSTLYALFGRQTVSACVPVSHQAPPVKLTGLVGRPDLSRSNRNQQFFFVNGRVIRSKAMTAAVDEAYRTLLMKGKFAFAVLFLELPSQLVDVNVHPQKLEVRFWNDQEIFRTLFHGIKQALTEHAGLFKEDESQAEDGKKQTAGQQHDNGETASRSQHNQSKAQPGDQQSIQAKPQQVAFEDQLSRSGQSGMDQTGRAEKTAGGQGTDQADEAADRHLAAHDQADAPSGEHVAYDQAGPDQQDQAAVRLGETGSDPEAEPRSESSSLNDRHQRDMNAHKPTVLRVDALRQARLIGQLFQTYLLFEYEDEMLLLDQHAAHEKILFEALVARQKKRREQGQAESAQNLLVPLTVSVSSREMQALQQNSKQMTQLGFEFEPFGTTSVLIRSQPDGELKQLKTEQAFRMALDALINDDVSSDEQITDLYYSMACKAAVKAHDSLKPAEVTRLLDDLLKLENPYQCPHGRPVMIRLSRYELEKKFKRVI